MKLRRNYEDSNPAIKIGESGGKRGNTINAL